MTTLKTATAKKEVLEMEKLIGKGNLKSWEILAAITIQTYIDVNSFKSLELLKHKEAVDKFHTLYLCDLSKVIGEMLNMYYQPFTSPYIKVETVLNELLGNGVFTNWITITGCNVANVESGCSLFDFFITYRGHSYRFTSENSLAELL